MEIVRAPKDGIERMPRSLCELDMRPTDVVGISIVVLRKCRSLSTRDEGYSITQSVPGFNIQALNVWPFPSLSLRPLHVGIYTSSGCCHGIGLFCGVANDRNSALLRST